MLGGFSPRFGNKLRGYRIVMTLCLAVMAVTIPLGKNQPAEVIVMIASMNAVVFGLLGFVLLYLDRKLPAYAQSGWISKCLILIGSSIFLGVAFLKLV